jgi:FkbM family methyltransferase
MIRNISFRGGSFQIWSLETYPNHASWTSFDDEINIKEAFWHIQPGAHVLDIGAAFGSYALTALAQGAGMVWAWSPQGHPGETEQEVLQKSIILNGWGDKCIVYNTGLYSSVGYLHTVNQTIQSTIDDEFVARTAGNIIKVETLDSWAGRELSTSQRVDWMKLDVEGAEVEVLKGAANTILKYKPNIQVENHIFKRASIADEVRQFLNELDYQEVGNIPYTAAVTHSLYKSK